MTANRHSYEVRHTDEEGHTWTLADLLTDLDSGDYLYLTPKMCADLAKHLRSGPNGVEKQFIEAIRNLVNGSKFDLTDSPKSLAGNVVRLVNEYDEAIRSATLNGKSK